MEDRITEERITEIQNCDPSLCPLHSDILDRILNSEKRTNERIDRLEGEIMDRIIDSENRTDDKISKLDGEVSEIYQELRKQAEDTAYVRANIGTVLAQQTQMGNDIKELRTGMMELVTTTLQQSRTDMSVWMQMTEKHRQEQDSRDKDNQAKSEEKDKAFYRKLIIACISVLATIVLSFFGIKALIPIFSG